jgi:hypothetical protein
VQEYGFIRAETTRNRRHDISSARKATLAMADGPVSLSPVGVKPLINEIEVVTAVVDLAVAVASQLSAFDDRDGLPPSVPHSSQRFCQMHRGIRVMADPEQQDLAIEVVDATDRTVQAMGNVQRMLGGNPTGFRPIAAKACGLSLRRTLGIRQNMSATTPIPRQGVLRGSNG